MEEKMIVKNRKIVIKFFILLSFFVLSLIGFLAYFKYLNYKFNDTCIYLLLVTSLFLFLTIYNALLSFVKKIEIYKDKLVLYNIFHYVKEYSFSEIVFQDIGNGIDVINMDGQFITRISYQFANSKEIMNLYKKYLKNHGVSVRTKSLLITPSFVFRNISGAMLFVGVIFFFPFIATTINKEYLYGILFCFCFILFSVLGILGVIHYYKFKIITGDSRLYIKNKYYKYEELALIDTGNYVKICINGKCIKTLNYYIYQNCNILFTRIRKDTNQSEKLVIESQYKENLTNFMDYYYKFILVGLGLIVLFFVSFNVQIKYISDVLQIVLICIGSLGYFVILYIVLRYFIYKKELYIQSYITAIVEVISIDTLSINDGFKTFKGIYKLKVKTKDDEVLKLLLFVKDFKINSRSFEKILRQKKIKINYYRKSHVISYIERM